MALQVIYWKMSGKSDIEIKTIRLRKKSDVEHLDLVNSRPKDTDIVTLERTDRQSPYFDVLWQSGRYKSLVIRSG